MFTILVTTVCDLNVCDYLPFKTTRPKWKLWFTQNREIYSGKLSTKPSHSQYWLWILSCLVFCDDI